LPAQGNSGRPWPLFLGALDVLNKRKNHFSEADKTLRQKTAGDPHNAGKTHRNAIEHCPVGQPNWATQTGNRCGIGIGEIISASRILDPAFFTADGISS